MQGEHSALREQKKKPSLISLVIEVVVIVVVALGLATLVTHFVCQPYEIPSKSMEQTIQVGDRVFSEKLSYLSGKPEVGQIVTFTEVGNPDKVLIKRVIATGGQTVDLRDGVVYVDGVAQDEPYTQGKPSYDLNSGITYPFQVPEGYIWVMGDNRTNSSDSRAFGPIPLENVTGHAFFRYWPLDRLGTL